MVVRLRLQERTQRRFDAPWRKKHYTICVPRSGVRNSRCQRLDSNPAAPAIATQGVGVVRARQHERELVPAASSQLREQQGVAQVM